MFLSLVTVGNIQQVTAHFAKVLSDMYFWINRKQHKLFNCLDKEKELLWEPFGFPGTSCLLGFQREN